MLIVGVFMVLLITFMAKTTTEGTRVNSGVSCNGTTCHPDASCVENTDGKICKCNYGLTENETCRVRKQCGSSACHPDSICTQRGSDCVCKTGFTGNGKTCSAVSATPAPSSHAVTSTPGTPSAQETSSSSVEQDSMLLSSVLPKGSTIILTTTTEAKAVLGTASSSHSVFSPLVTPSAKETIRSSVAHNFSVPSSILPRVFINTLMTTTTVKAALSTSSSSNSVIRAQTTPSTKQTSGSYVDQNSVVPSSILPKISTVIFITTTVAMAVSSPSAVTLSFEPYLSSAAWIHPRSSNALFDETITPWPSHPVSSSSTVTTHLLQKHSSPTSRIHPSTSFASPHKNVTTSTSDPVSSSSSAARTAELLQRLLPRTRRIYCRRSYTLPIKSITPSPSNSADVATSPPGTNNQTICPPHAHCIKTANSSCVCYCMYVAKGCQGIHECLTKDTNLLPNARIYLANRQPLGQDAIKPAEERMFQASVESGFSKGIPGYLSFNWYIRNVQVSPFAISTERTLVDRNSSLTWTPPVGSLPAGVKLIEFEVTLRDVRTTRRDFGFIKVEKANLFAWISGGSARLSSSNYPLHFDGSKSFDPELGEKQYFGMDFVWTCYDGGTKGQRDKHQVIMVAFERTETNDGNCSGIRFESNGTTAVIRHPLAQHVYYIELEVQKNMRRTKFLQTLYTSDEEILEVFISCLYNCKNMVVTSHRFALKTITAARRRENATFTWHLYKKGAKRRVPLRSLIATKKHARNIVFNEGKLDENSSYWLTLSVTFPNGTHGWAAYHFKTAGTPTGGTCKGIQLDKRTLGIYLNMSCTGWKDQHEPLTFEFYHWHKLEDKTPPHLLSHTVMPFSEVLLPDLASGEIEIKAVVINSLGARNETSMSVRVVQPSWLNDNVIAFSAFMETWTLFNTSLIEGKMCEAWQLAHVMMRAMDLDKRPSWVTNDLVQNVKEHIIEELSTARVRDVQTVLQLSSVLKEATALSDAAVSADIMGIALHSIRRWAAVASMRVKNNSVKDLALVRDSWKMLLHCSGNIHMATTRLASLKTTKRAKIQNLSRIAMKMYDTISDAELSRKLPGEQYSVYDTIHKTVFLGVQEVADMSNWKLQEEQTSVRFPHLSKDISQGIFGNLSEVSFQMIDFKVNPYTAHEPSSVINSQVLSFIVKDVTGHVINVSNLHTDISLTVPLKKSKNSTERQVVEYSVPEVMIYRLVTTHRKSTSIRISLTLDRGAPFQVYVKHGTRPTKQDYDFSTTLDARPCLDKANVCNVSHHIWFDAKDRGTYFIGLLQTNSKLKGRKRRSALDNISSESHALGDNAPRQRVSESLLQINDTEHQCVKIKVSPKRQETIVLPAYDHKTTVNFTLEVDSAGCLYWSEEEEEWKSEGCKVGPDSTSTTLHCLCNHLTSFGGYFLVSPNTIDFSQVKVGFSNIDQFRDVLVLGSVSVVFLVYFAALIFARRADKRDKEKVRPVMPLESTGNNAYQYKATITTGPWRNSGTSAQVSMKLFGTENSSNVIEFTTSENEHKDAFSRGNVDSFLFRVDQPLGDLLKLYVGHDSSGEDPSWFLNEITITDVQANSQWTFPCYRWLALELADGCTSIELYAKEGTTQLGFKNEFNSARTWGLANDHLWFSVATKEPRDSFTRVQRVTCCCFFFLLGMLISAMFYNVQGTDNTPPIQVGPLKMTIRELVVSIETALLAFPPSFLVVFIFRKSRRSTVTTGRGRFHLPRFCIYVAWFVCIVGSLAAAVLVIFYSLQWGGDTSSRWLSSIFLTTVEDIFVSQPIKIVLFSFLLALFVTSRRNHQKDDSSGATATDPEDSQSLFEISQDQIEHCRKYRVIARKTNTFIRDILFSCVFLVLLTIVSYGERSEHRYRMVKSTENGFTKLDKIKNKFQLWKWLEDVWIPATFAGKWYNGQEETSTEYIGNKMSILVGMPRLRQLRVLKDSCVVPSQFINSITSCYDSYSKEEEDKMGWNVLSNTNSSTRADKACLENWKYRSKEILGSHESRGVHALYGGGGYVADLGYDGQTARGIINDLMTNGWIDRQTRVVMVEISAFNAGTKLLADTTLYFEMLPSGLLGPSMKIEVIPWVKSDFVHRVIFLIFGFALGYFFVRECVKFVHLKCSYFSSIWNWLEMLQITSTLLVIAFSIQREIKMSLTLLKLKVNPHAPISFHNARFWFEVENTMICIALTIAALRLLRLMKFNSHVVILLMAMRKSMRPLMSFTVVFAIVFIAYGHAGLLLFGKNVYMFSSWRLVIVSQFLMSLGGHVPREELVEENRILAPLYNESFLFLTVLILINMFVAILNEAQTESTNSTKDEDDIEVANLLLSKFRNFLGISSEYSFANKVVGGSKKSPNGEVLSPGTATCIDKETRQREVSVTIEGDMANTFGSKKGFSNDPRDPIKLSDRCNKSSASHNSSFDIKTSNVHGSSRQSYLEQNGSSGYLSSCLSPAGSPLFLRTAISRDINETLSLSFNSFDARLDPTNAFPVSSSINPFTESYPEEQSEQEDVHTLVESNQRTAQNRQFETLTESAKDECTSISSVDDETSLDVVRTAVHIATDVNVRDITVMAKIIDFDEVSEWIKRNSSYRRNSAPPDSTVLRGKAPSRPKNVDFYEISRWMKRTSDSRDSTKSHASKKSTETFAHFRPAGKINCITKNSDKKCQTNTAQLESRVKRLDELLQDLDLLE